MMAKHPLYPVLLVFGILVGLPVPDSVAAIPPNARALNVKDFGAKGDGVSDDTKAIRAAIAALPDFDAAKPFQARGIHFPAGTYVVSETIRRSDRQGRYQPALVLIGDGPAASRLKLADKASGFTDRREPRPVLFFSSALTGGSPLAGGKRYEERGEGNEAYQNIVEDMTIDVGSGNPGAIGIDYLANNLGVIRRVNVVSDTNEGAFGIRMIRKWIGPALISEVQITGFDVGVDVGQTEYSITLERITIAGSRSVGIKVVENVVNLADFSMNVSSGFGFVVTGKTAGLIALGGRITGNGRATLLDRGGMRHMAAIDASKFVQTGREDPPKINGIFLHGTALGESAFNLPRTRPPTAPDLRPEDWVSVEQFGVRPDSGRDETAGIRAALASGKAGIVFPSGEYQTQPGLQISSRTAVVDGMFATFRILRRSQAKGPDGRAISPQDDALFDVPSRAAPLHLRRINVTGGGQLGVIVRDRGGAGTVLSDVGGLAAALIHRTSEGGPLFVENASASGIRLAGSKGAWLRHFNTEGTGIRIRNDGSPLWVLGLKTEQQMTVLDNRDGANTEVIGGFHYMVRRTIDRDIPLYVNKNARLVATYAEESFFAETSYRTHLADEVGGTPKITTDALPLRGRFSRFAPQIEDR